MAGVFLLANTGDITVSASTAKTVLQIVAPAQQRVRIHNFCISFAGTSGTDNPALIRWVRQTTAGTMSALTLVKQDGDADETIQTTAQADATIAPTTTDVMRRFRCHPQGNFAWDFGGRNSDFIVTGGERFGLEITLGAAPSSTTCTVSVLLEE